jgi:hypothetical protein
MTAAILRTALPAVVAVAVEERRSDDASRD